MTTRKRVRRERRLEWIPLVSWVSQRTIAGKTLGLNVTAAEPGNYLAVAIETDAMNLAGVFENHAHDVIGRFKTELGARRACERYLKKWEAGSLAKCHCAPIEATKPRRAG